MKVNVITLFEIQPLVSITQWGCAGAAIAVHLINGNEILNLNVIILSAVGRRFFNFTSSVVSPYPDSPKTVRCQAEPTDCC